MSIQGKIFICFLVQLYGINAFSQIPTIEDQLSKLIIRCEDIHLNALEVIPHLHKTQPLIQSSERSVSGRKNAKYQKKVK